MSNHGVVPPAEVVTVSPAGLDQIRSLVYQLFALNDPNQIVDRAVEIASNVEESPDKPAFELALRGVACFGAGLRAAQQVELPAAAENLGIAVKCFDAIGIADATSVSYAFLCYVDGTRNAMLLNLDRAREQWNEAERHLKEAGGLQEKYRILLDQSKPDQLFISAMNALARQDYNATRLLLEEASKAANGFAERYLAPEDPNCQYFRGLADFYVAYYDFADSFRDFLACGYDRLIDRRIELTRAAESATSLLSMKSYPNEIRRRLGILAATINKLQHVLVDFSLIMKEIMLANFNRDQGSLVQLRAKIAEASKLASALGSDGVSLLRQCEQLGRQVDNVERLTRPTVKDFGLFSGLVAMFAFVPLLIVTSWVFKYFEWGAPPIALIWLNVGVACLVGFGAGALKLLPALMGGKQKG